MRIGTNQKISFCPRRWTQRSLLALAVLSLSVPASAATGLGYVEATSELHKGRPASFSYNVVDGKPNTAWCAAKGAQQGEGLTFGFTGTQKITEVGFLVGTAKDGKLSKKYARPKVIRLFDGQIERRLELRDKGTLQSVRLDPPISARRVTVEVLEAREGKGETAPVCIAEIEFKNGKSTITGDALKPRLRSLNNPARKLLHTWIDEVSAPERTLAFFLDGTFRYNYEPLLEGKPVAIKGKWRTNGKTIIFTVRGKDMRMKARFTKVSEGDEPVTELALIGDGPDESLNATFRVLTQAL